MQRMGSDEDECDVNGQPQEQRKKQGLVGMLPAILFSCAGNLAGQFLRPSSVSSQEPLGLCHLSGELPLDCHMLRIRAFSGRSLSMDAPPHFAFRMQSKFFMK